MITKALEAEIPVALVGAEPAGTSSRHEGILAHLQSVAGCGRVRLLERRADDTMLIALEGIGKVRLRDRIVSETPYIVASVDWIPEPAEVSQANILLLHRVDLELKRWLESHVNDENTRRQFAAELESPQERINYFCSLAVSDADEQQRLLEMNTLDERLEHLALFFSHDDELSH